MNLLPVTATSGASNPKIKCYIQEGVNPMIWIFCALMILLCHIVDW